MYKNNSRNISKINGFNPLYLFCNLTRKCYAVGLLFLYSTLYAISVKTESPFMKRPIFILLLLITFFVTTSFLSVDVDISGKFYSDNADLNKQLVGMQFFAKYEGNVVAKTTVDNSGHYEISINVGLSNGLKNTYDFYITSFGTDTCFIKSFQQFNGEEMTWDIKLPNTYKKIMGRTICPKCETGDKVFPIIYGDNQKEVEIITKSDTTYSNIVNKKYYAGTCIRGILSPNWYCDKDKIHF